MRKFYIEHVQFVEYGKRYIFSLFPVWKRNGTVIFENGSAYSILSVTPAVPGHALVIPKRHVENLQDLRGKELEDFVDALPGTKDAIRELYKGDASRIVEFYQGLVSNPPIPISRDLGEMMLGHEDLRVPPDEIAYNIGINVGEYAGQMVNHFHAQLFPRRERGAGIVTMVRSYLSPDSRET